MYILSIDQGTTGTRAVIFDKCGRLITSAYQEFQQIFPKSGWVEHDPEEIWNTVKNTVEKVCSEITGIIDAIGISNQRETTIVWDKKTGRPVYNAIVWQCRRTAKYCEALKHKQSLIKQITGLPVDAYFSGTKIKWILDNVKNINPENVLFGTIDSWLVWKLTNGNHFTDFTNASRTMLFDIKEKKWSPPLCELMSIPQNILPEVKNSISDFGSVKSIACIKGIPIYGVAGDQQAALFGQQCFNEGQIKNTYGTGCFIMMNTGNRAIESKKGLITTLAIDCSGNSCYALEGAIFIAGAAVQWLRDELKLIGQASETEQAATSIADNGGVYFVPAFVGLGTPHWDMEARGTITGLTRGCNRNHIIRAALESIAYQTKDVLSTIKMETGIEIKILSVDGGAAENDFLLQFQADILNLKIIRPELLESTSLGAAYLAGLKAGMWKDHEEICEQNKNIKIFTPSMKREEREILLTGWQKALRQAKTK